jgi:hypothetical protein
LRDFLRTTKPAEGRHTEFVSLLRDGGTGL